MARTPAIIQISMPPPPARRRHSIRRYVNDIYIVQSFRGGTGAGHGCRILFDEKPPTTHEKKQPKLALEAGSKTFKNQIGIFNVARITGVVTKSTKVKSICGQLRQNVWK